MPGHRIPGTRIPYLDKLVDEVAKGRPMAKVLRTP